jgi:nitronate monooxygenase
MDTVVNNAGVFIAKPFTEYSEKDFAAMIAVNLAGFFHLSQKAAAWMLRMGSGQQAHEHETVVTNVFSGRPARALVNRLACEIGFLADAVPDFPLPLGELGPLRAAAEQKGSRDFTPLWSGQAAALSREMPAAMLMQITVKETLERLHRLRCN